MRVKSLNDWADGSNRFIFSFFLLYYSTDYYFQYGKLPPHLYLKEARPGQHGQHGSSVFFRDISDCGVTFGL